MLSIRLDAMSRIAENMAYNEGAEKKKNFSY